MKLSGNIIRVRYHMFANIYYHSNLFVLSEQLAVLMSARRNFLLLEAKFGSATDKRETSPGPALFVLLGVGRGNQRRRDSRVLLERKIPFVDRFMFSAAPFLGR